MIPDDPSVDVLRPSPNHSERRDGRRPDMLLLHYTGMATLAGALDRLTDPATELSSHYVVGEDGSVFQLVAEARRAHHAGRGSWGPDQDINSCSVGIEIANGGHAGGLPPFPDRQIDAVIALARGIVARQRIPPSRVLAHSDIAPARKEDPGEHFPWHRLAEAGLCLWVEPEPIRPGPTLGPGDGGPEVEDIQASLRRIGYGLPATARFDAETTTVVRAFQRRHRPALVDGIADPSTRTTLRRVVSAG